MRSIWTEACVVDNIRGSSNCTEYLFPRWAMARRTASLQETVSIKTVFPVLSYMLGPTFVQTTVHVSITSTAACNQDVYFCALASALRAAKHERALAVDPGSRTLACSTQRAVLMEF
jgi:hypothetical protein